MAPGMARFGMWDNFAVPRGGGGGELWRGALEGSFGGGVLEGGFFGREGGFL